MSTTRYDRYGRPAGYQNPIEGKVEAYLVDKTSDTTQYICYYETGSDPRAIRRIVKASGQTQICVGWGAWTDRTTIDYYPVNSVFTVNDDDKSLASVAPYNTPISPIS